MMIRVMQMLIIMRSIIMTACNNHDNCHIIVEYGWYASHDVGNRIVQRPKKSELSGWQTFTRKNFPDQVRKLFSRHVCQERVNRFFRSVPKCVNSPETFQPVRKPSRLSGNFPDSSETFQTVRKISRLSGNFSDCTETFQTVRKPF